MPICIKIDSVLDCFQFTSVRSCTKCQSCPHTLLREIRIGYKLQVMKMEIDVPCNQDYKIFIFYLWTKMSIS